MFGMLILNLKYCCRAIPMCNSSIRTNGVSAMDAI